MPRLSASYAYDDPPRLQGHGAGAFPESLHLHAQLVRDGDEQISDAGFLLLDLVARAKSQIIGGKAKFR